jgi:ABC-2 type transport system permease protein
VIALVRSEVRKLTSTQVWFWLLLLSTGIIALFTSLTILTDGGEGNPNPTLLTGEGQRNLLSITGFAGVFAALLGIIGITAEYRHLTITPTFLATPRRNRVVIAKLATYFLVGVGYAVVGALVLAAISLPWLSARHIEIEYTANHLPQVLLATMLGVAIYGLLGVGLGVLIRNQVAAVVLLLVEVFVIESLLANLPWTRDHLAKWLPGQAASALSETYSQNTTLLEPWQGGLLLVGYGLAFALLGMVLTTGRDVT